MDAGTAIQKQAAEFRSRASDFAAAMVRGTCVDYVKYREAVVRVDELTRAATSLDELYAKLFSTEDDDT